MERSGDHASQRPPVRAPRPAGHARPSLRLLTAALSVAAVLVLPLLIAMGGAAAPGSRAPREAPYVEGARLGAFDGRRAEHFGYAVALDGNTLAVGARNARVDEGNQAAEL
ncbi:MAG TPA: FG-GAP repeat protein [Baekduia sp.]